MADDKTTTSPVKATEEKEVVDGAEVGTTTPTKSPVKAKDCTDSSEPTDAPTNGSPEKRDASKGDVAAETPNGDSAVETAEPVVCPVKRKSAVTKDGEKEEDAVVTPEKKVKKDEEPTEVVEKETASA